MNAAPASRGYNDKRARGKTHAQTLLRLARQRISVLFAVLRGGTSTGPAPSHPPRRATIPDNRKTRTTSSSKDTEAPPEHHGSAYLRVRAAAASSV